MRFDSIRKLEKITFFTSKPISLNKLLQQNENESTKFTSISEHLKKHLTQFV